MSLRALSINALASSAGTIGNAVVLFALYRFLALELGIEAIGAWALVLSGAGLARLAEVGVAAATTKAVANELGADRPREAMAAVATGGAFLALALALGALAAWPLAGLILDATIDEPDLRDAAGRILPWALGGAWCAGLVNLFAATLDGNQRTGLRALVTVLGQLVTYAAALLLVPGGGLAALGPVSFAGHAVQLLMLLGAVQLVMRQPVRTWGAFSFVRLRALLRYGATLQVSAVGQLLFEPSVRWLLGIFGDLALTGLYELASRAITQARLALVAAFQMIVPFHAHRIGRAGGDAVADRRAYVGTAELALLVSVPYFALLGAALPYLLTWWTGTFSPVFVAIGFACLAGWCINALSAPAYMLYLAIGRLRWVALNQLVIGLLNVALGAALGAAFGGPGVVAGAMLALGLGSLTVVERFHAEHDVRIRDVLPASLPGTLMASALGVAGCAWWALARWRGDGTPWPALAMFALMGVALAALAWRDPVRLALQRRIAPGTLSARAPGNETIVEGG